MLVLAVDEFMVSGHVVHGEVACPGLYVPFTQGVQLLEALARPCPGWHTHAAPCRRSVPVLAQVQFSALVLPLGDVWRAGSGHGVHSPMV